MTAASEPGAGLLALGFGAVAVLALLLVRVKLRAGAGRRLGIRIYDFGAHLDLPPTLHSRSYQFALYLTMKSLPREPAEAAAPGVSPARSRG